MDGFLNYKLEQRVPIRLTWITNALKTQSDQIHIYTYEHMYEHITNQDSLFVHWKLKHNLKAEPNLCMYYKYSCSLL